MSQPDDQADRPPLPISAGDSPCPAKTAAPASSGDAAATHRRASLPPLFARRIELQFPVDRRGRSLIRLHRRRTTATAWRDVWIDRLIQALALLALLPPALLGPTVFVDWTGSQAGGLGLGLVAMLIVLGVFVGGSSVLFAWRGFRQAANAAALSLMIQTRRAQPPPPRDRPGDLEVFLWTEMRRVRRSLRWARLIGQALAAVVALGWLAAFASWPEAGDPVAFRALQAVAGFLGLLVSRLSAVLWRSPDAAVLWAYRGIEDCTDRAS